MANFEFVSVLTDAIAASGGSVAGVAIDASGEMQAFGAGQLDVDVAEQTARALISLASRLMFRACNDLGPATELGRPVQNHRRVDSNLRTFDITAAAAILQMSTWMLGRMAGRGVVPAAKVGRRWIFTEEALAEYLRGEINKQTAERRGEPEKTSLDPKLYYPTGRRRPAPPPPLDGPLVKIR